MHTPAADPTASRQIILLGYGSLVLLGWGGVIRSVQQDFRISDAEFGVLYVLADLCAAAGSLRGGLLTERTGPRLRPLRRGIAVHRWRVGSPLAVLQQ